MKGTFSYFAPAVGISPSTHIFVVTKIWSGHRLTVSQGCSTSFRRSNPTRELHSLAGAKQKAPEGPIVVLLRTVEAIRTWIVYRPDDFCVPNLSV